MIRKKARKSVDFKGIDVAVEVERFVCPDCGMEAGTIESAGAVQRAVAEAYRSQTGLLTGQQIRALRKQKGLTQKGLADLMNVGIASIKRWETGLIQSKAMDHALRIHLEEHTPSNPYSGGRDFSIERVKLVIRTFESRLKRRLIKKTDKMLFAAKYLWYADMLSYKHLKRGMTGASYAALPYGPQLNNYTDLVDEIKKAKDEEAETLSRDEVEIIEKICEAFPTNKKVYDAAHREKTWSEKAVGAMIPYSDAAFLTQVDPRDQFFTGKWEEATPPKRAPARRIQSDGHESPAQTKVIKRQRRLTLKPFEQKNRS